MQFGPGSNSELAPGSNGIWVWERIVLGPGVQMLFGPGPICDLGPGPICDLVPGPNAVWSWV